MEWNQGLSETSGFICDTITSWCYLPPGGHRYQMSVWKFPSYDASLSNGKGRKLVELVTGFSGAKSYAPSSTSQRFPLTCFHMEWQSPSLFGDSPSWGQPQKGAWQLIWCSCTAQKTLSIQRTTMAFCVWSYTSWVSPIPVVSFSYLAHLNIPVFFLLLLFSTRIPTTV